MSETHRVRFTGIPAFASALAQALNEQDGISVEPWERPREERGWTDAPEQIVVSLTVTGTLAAVKLAAAKFNERMGMRPGTADVDPPPEPGPPWHQPKSRGRSGPTE
jgi:hypothetical protein